MTASILYAAFFKANVEGSRKIFDLFRTHLASQDKAFVDKVERNFATVDLLLSKYQTAGGGFVAYDKVSERDRKAMTGPVNTLAEDLSTMRGKLGLN